MTELKNITILEHLNEDIFSVVYSAYDKVKKDHCYLTMSKKETSWIYSIEY